MEKLLFALMVLLPACAMAAWSMFAVARRRAKYAWASYSAHSALRRARVWRIVALVLTAGSVVLWAVVLVFFRDAVEFPAALRAARG